MAEKTFLRENAAELICCQNMPVKRGILSDDIAVAALGEVERRTLERARHPSVSSSPSAAAQPRPFRISATIALIFLSSAVTLMCCGHFRWQMVQPTQRSAPALTPSLPS